MTILEAAKRISKVIDCEIIISKDNEDNRNYKVSSDKINKMGFQFQKNIETAIEEIKIKIENDDIKDYKENRYSNYKTLFSSKEMQDKVFINSIN